MLRLTIDNSRLHILVVVSVRFFRVMTRRLLMMLALVLLLVANRILIDYLRLHIIDCLMLILVGLGGLLVVSMDHIISRLVIIVPSRLL